MEGDEGREIVGRREGGGGGGRGRGPACSPSQSFSRLAFAKMLISRFSVTVSKPQSCCPTPSVD